MWRAIFLALGINLIILGVQCLVVEKVVLRDKSERVLSRQTDTNGGNGSSFFNASYKTNSTGVFAPKRVFKPKDWMPWSLLAGGAVIVIYTASSPGRREAKSD